MVRGKEKSAVDVLDDMCQASLLYVTNVAIICLNSFLGHAITGPKKANRGARVQSIELQAVFDRKVPVFSEEASHFSDAVNQISSLGLAMKPQVVFELGSGRV